MGWVVPQWLSSYWKGRGPDSYSVHDAGYLSSPCIWLKAWRATPLPSMLEGQRTWVQMLAAVAAAVSSKMRGQESENPISPSAWTSKVFPPQKTMNDLYTLVQVHVSWFSLD